MGKFKEIFNYACNNDVKALNKAIESEGHRHHAIYMTNMMFVDDINKNYQLFLEIRNTINTLYYVISENYLLKRKIRDILEEQYRNKLLIRNELEVLTEKELFKLVYQQALEYYFRIDVANSSNFNSYIDEAIQYRIVSGFLQNDIERILLKVNEDMEIVIEDTKNLRFLVKNLKKFDKANYTYRFVLKQLTESIQNVILRENKFDEEYFVTVKEVAAIIQTIL